MSRTSRGAALLLVLLLLVAAGGVVLFAYLEDIRPELSAQRKTALALAEAKQALLGAAVWDNSGANPGRLLCPDQDDDGAAQGAACQAPYVGRVPWQTLDLPDLRDGSGERLWLVVDGAFRSRNAPMNTTVQPTLALDGRPVVAVLVAPGRLLASRGQDRASGKTLDWRNYLEVFTGGPALATGALSATYNDQVLAVTPDELFGLVTLRVVQALALANPVLPAAPDGFVKPQVWTDNAWDDAVARLVPGGSHYELVFKNCAIVYTLAPGGRVGRSGRTC